MTTKKIYDEFTGLKVSKQRKYQLRKMRFGLCKLCGKKAVTKKFCETHRIKAKP